MRVTRVVPALFDPRLRTATEILWPSVCTIQALTYTISDSNQRVVTGAVNLVGIIEIPCRLGPIVRERPTDDMNQFRNSVEEFHARRHLDLNGYFPQIEAWTMQAVIDTVVYPIRGVEHDGQRWITRLKLDVLDPHG